MQNRCNHPALVRFDCMDASIGIGACEPRVIMKTSRATLEEAARIARDIGTARGQGGWH